MAPWDLIDQSAGWLLYAEAAMEAEARAAEKLRQRAERRQKRQGA